MDVVNPLNVIKLLEVDYGQQFQLDDTPSEADKQFKEIVKAFIDEKIFRAGTLFAVEEDLQYELEIDYATFEELESTVAELSLQNGHDEAHFEEDRLMEPASSGTEPSSHELYVPRIPNPKAPPGKLVSLDYKRRVVEFWSNASTKKRRSLSCVKSKFKRVTSVQQLHDWKKHVEEGGSRLDKLKALRLETGKKFFLAKKRKHVVKDLDVRRWALTANQTVGLEGFTASPDWIGKVKRYYNICDRKITKFVTEKSIREQPLVKQSAEECVALVRSRIEEFGLECLWNADQSGFEYEMRPGRTLDIRGAKHVEALTQSENSMTHSYTVMMTVSPGTRNFLPVLFLTLQEPKGVFGPVVSRTMFKAENLYVTASNSGKMTKKLYLEWCAEVLFPHMDNRCILLADSWTTFNDQDAVLELKPDDLEYEMLRIPPKVTGEIQPLDVLFFRMYKAYFKKISNFIILHDLPIQVHHRDVILKSHSLVYQQFQSPRFRGLVPAAWYESGYTDENVEYVNPAKYCFDQLTSRCFHENCNSTVLLICGWCKGPLCFRHFYDVYHFCQLHIA